MTRSTLFVRTSAALAASLVALAAQALEIKPYSAEALQAAQAAGQPVAVHFRADWCPTCRAQDKSFVQLKAEKGLDITVLSADYDKEKVGWKIREVASPETSMPGHEGRKIYDTTLPGRGNGGHTYGDGLTAEERAAVIEYLKTL